MTKAISSTSKYRYKHLFTTWITIYWLSHLRTNAHSFQTPSCNPISLVSLSKHQGYVWEKKIHCQCDRALYPLLLAGGSVAKGWMEPPCGKCHWKKKYKNLLGNTWNMDQYLRYGTRKYALQLCVKLRKHHFSSCELANREWYRGTHVMSVFVKLALQLVDNSTSQKGAWIIRKPNTSFKSLFVDIVPIREHGFECKSNGSCHRFRKRIIRPSSSKRGTASRYVSRNE